MAVFKGFSSPLIGNTQVLQDKELIKQDLLNHFNTFKGEKPMNQEYGFIGHDLVFELDRPRTRTKIEADAKRIISLDPRVVLKNISITYESNGYTIAIDLYFNVLDEVDTLYYSYVSDTESQQF